MNIKFKYKIITVEELLTETKLNELGLDGWELSAVVKKINTKYFGPGCAIKNYVFVYHFKKQIDI